MLKNVSLNFYNNLMVIVGFFIAALYSYGHLIDGDVIQNLVKAHEFVTYGTATPYGNISSSGISGNVPGVFLTLVAGLPMKLIHSPWSALAVIAVMHFFALLMFVNVFKKYVSPLGITALYVFFWLNPWRASEVFLWNPAYIYFVSVLHMWSAYYLSKKRSFWFSFIHAQSLFLGLQVHPSFIILFFVTMLLLWTKSMRPNWKGTFAGVLFGIITLVPYIVAGLNDPSIFPQTGGGEDKGFLFFGLIYVYPMIKAFWYWILFGSTIFQTHIFHQTEYSWIDNEVLRIFFKYFWLVLKYAVGIAGVLFSFNVNYRFFKKHKKQFNVLKYKLTSKDNWLAQYAILAFVSAIIATAISPTLPIYWHLLYVWPMAIIPLVFRFDELLKNSEWVSRSKWVLAFCGVYFVVFNVVGALGSKKHDISSSFHELYFKQCKEHCVRPDQ